MNTFLTDFDIFGDQSRLRNNISPFSQTKTKDINIYEETAKSFLDT